MYDNDRDVEDTFDHSPSVHVDFATDYLMGNDERAPRALSPRRPPLREDETCLRSTSCIHYLVITATKISQQSSLSQCVNTRAKSMHNFEE